MHASTVGPSACASAYDSACAMRALMYALARAGANGCRNNVSIVIVQ